MSIFPGERLPSLWTAAFFQFASKVAGPETFTGRAGQLSILPSLWRRWEDSHQLALAQADRCAAWFIRIDKEDKYGDNDNKMIPRMYREKSGNQVWKIYCNGEK